MVAVLKLYADADNFNGVNLPDGTFERSRREAVLSGRALDWVAIDAEPFGDRWRVEQPIGDMVEFYPALPVVSGRAWELLDSIQPGSSRAYPIRVKGMQYFLWSVQRFSGALDLPRSSIDYFHSGRMSFIREHVFVPSLLTDAFFKIEQMGPTGPVYLRDDLWRALKAKGFTGFDGVVKVWADAP